MEKAGDIENTGNREHQKLGEAKPIWPRDRRKGNSVRSFAIIVFDSFEYILCWFYYLVGHVASFPIPPAILRRHAVRHGRLRRDHRHGEATDRSRRSRGDAVRHDRTHPCAVGRQGSEGAEAQRGSAGARRRRHGGDQPERGGPARGKAGRRQFQASRSERRNLRRGGPQQGGSARRRSQAGRSSFART